MAREIERLTEIKIRGLIAPGHYPDGGGLYLQISKAGTRSWVWRFRFAGKVREAGLGSLLDVGLVAARRKADEYRAQLARGIDPIEHARTSRLAASPMRAPLGPTFREMAEKYMDAKLKRLRSEVHRKQWRYSLETFAYPIIGEMSVAAIETPDILRVLEPIWETKCETAMRLRGRIERILARSAVEGLRKGNPALWRGHLAEALPKRSDVSPVRHFPAMKFAEVPTFLADLQKRQGITAAALQFLILTATRTGEVRGATWSEIDRNAQTWCIPSTRTKAKRSHVVPLSDAALTILREVEPLREQTTEQFIFPGPSGALSSNAMLALVQRRMNRPDVVPHGFRSSFRDWCGDVADVPRELAEAALAHVVADATERAYRRGTAIERRRTLMQQWADFCLPPAGGVVVPLRAAG
jgi:integrase